MATLTVAKILRGTAADASFVAGHWTAIDPDDVIQCLLAVSGYAAIEFSQPNSPEKTDLALQSYRALLGEHPRREWLEDLFALNAGMHRVSPGGFYIPSGCIMTLMLGTLSGTNPPLPRIASVDPRIPEGDLLSRGISGLPIEAVLAFNVVLESARGDVLKLHDLSQRDRMLAMKALLGI